MIAVLQNYLLWSGSRSGRYDAALWLTEPQSALLAQGANMAHAESTALEIARYVDSDYGFEMAVPAGWRMVVLDDVETQTQIPELGYAVGFEAARDSEGDQFTDYILLEILPGVDSGLFEATANDQQSLILNGELIHFDKLYIDGDRDHLSAVDLVIFQRELTALGYTVDFYAVGEPDNEDTLFEAFQIMLRTFKLNTAPFSLS